MKLPRVLQCKCITGRGRRKKEGEWGMPTNHASGWDFATGSSSDNSSCCCGQSVSLAKFPTRHIRTTISTSIMDLKKFFERINFPYDGGKNMYTVRYVWICNFILVSKCHDRRGSLGLAHPGEAPDLRAGERALGEPRHHDGKEIWPKIVSKQAFPHTLKK